MWSIGVGPTTPVRIARRPRPKPFDVLVMCQVPTLVLITVYFDECLVGCLGPCECMIIAWKTPGTHS